MWIVEKQALDLTAGYLLFFHRVWKSRPSRNPHMQGKLAQISHR